MGATPRQATAPASAWIHSGGVKRAPWLGCHSHAQRVPRPALQPVVSLSTSPSPPAPGRLSHRLCSFSSQCSFPTLNVPIYPSFKTHVTPFMTSLILLTGNAFSPSAVNIF